MNGNVLRLQTKNTTERHFTFMELSDVFCDTKSTKGRVFK
jgi:hypothetical protein